MRALAWLLVWWACLLVALWALIALPVSAIAGSGRRAWRLAVGYDQLGNIAAGGHEDETFSSRCWRNRERLLYANLVAAIDWAFFRIQGEQNHCQNAWMAEETRRKLPL